MRGKYSPTVSKAYCKDQNWWDKYAASSGRYPTYDPEGYDCYGYNEDGVDRAGYKEHVYYENSAGPDSDLDYNVFYDSALASWGFDGVKPVKR